MKSQTLPPPAPARDPLTRTAKSLGAVSRASFSQTVPALRCHVGHRSYMCLVFRVNSSFSSVIRRKRRHKHAVQHCPWHNLFTWASMLISALLNVPLGAAHEHFGTKLALLVGRRAHKMQKSCRRALSAGQSYHMGLYAHICTSKCAAGSPTATAAKAREHCGHTQKWTSAPVRRLVRHGSPGLGPD